MESAPSADGTDNDDYEKQKRNATFIFIFN